MVRANEEKVAVIDLASSEQSSSEMVTVFKSSNENIRIVLQTVPSLTPEQKVVIPQQVSVKEDKLIPRYALPTLVNPCLEVAVFSRNEEMLYKFDTFENLCKFQTALMGYDVPHDQQSIRCQFNKDATSLSGPEGDPTVGRIQLWQEPIVLPASFASADRERLTSAPPAPASETGLSRHDSVSPSLAPTSNIDATIGGWEADRIKLPSLVIFTLLADSKKGSKFAVIFVNLEPGIYVDPSLCRCHNNYDGCANLVLKSETKKTFPVRVLYSDVNLNGTLNPNTFDIFPLRLPHGPEFGKIPSKSTEFLLLNFKHEGLAGKRRFHEELTYRFMVRDKQIKDQREFEDSVRLRQDQPQKRRVGALSSQVATGNKPMSFRSFPTPTELSRRDSEVGGSVSSASTYPRTNSTGDEYGPNSRFGTMGLGNEDAGSLRTDTTMRASGPSSSPTGKAGAMHNRLSDPNRRVEFDPFTFGEDHKMPQSEFHMSKRGIEGKKPFWRR
ncbi:hypothetical protein DOTSEDRAFT_73700 [Dothistroma septosporum NZE10]|uniref:Uncharacterized protein n=1 Tax=Dothistroma septosporum (strain NZE10 / CBS 128990) TaxID=675120 RepID=N1PJ60_DOTSN|nr:hypothetical protein DOTSEDRAFT_73700 [Dothistroma septosporum NZE10]